MVLPRNLRILVLAGLVALPLAGCSSSSIYLSSKRMCEATGGTYTGTTCNPAGTTPRSAKQMCDTHGGTYVKDLDACRMDATTPK
jgi:hypothetical protein